MRRERCRVGALAARKLLTRAKNCCMTASCRRSSAPLFTSCTHTRVSLLSQLWWGLSCVSVAACLLHCVPGTWPGDQSKPAPFSAAHALPCSRACPAWTYIALLPADMLMYAQAAVYPDLDARCQSGLLDRYTHPAPACRGLTCRCV